MTNNTQTNVASSATQQAQPQAQSTNKNIKLPTAKIPPPSTKIPKSAVVMPDGTNSSINLDVQFGIDLYTPNSAKKEKEIEKQEKQAANLPSANNANKSNETVHTQILQQQQQQQQQKPKVVNNTQNKNVVLNSLMNKPLETQIVTNTNTNSNTNNNNLTKTNTDTLMRVAQSQSTTANVNSLESMQKSQQQFVDNKAKQPQYNQTYNNTNVHSQPHQSQQQQMINKPQQQVPQQQQQQQQQHHQTNQQTHNLNAANKPLISPKNVPTPNNSTTNTNGNNLGALNTNLKTQQPTQVQPQVSHTNSNGNLSQLQQLSQTNQPANATNATQANNMKPSTQMAPPPGVTGVNLLNPNNQFLMGLPFVCYDQQNFSYFDPSQLDSNLIQMYNHLASVPPPGVTGGPSAAAAAAAAAAVSANQTGQYSENKFTRNELNSAANSQLNASQLAQQQSQQQQQQQQPINLIPNLSNFPFFFPSN